MKGRFFFDPTKKETKKEVKESASNSILIRKGRTEIFWDEEENKMSAASEIQEPLRRKRVISHQKYCQTETATMGEIGIQAEVSMTDFCMQVGPLDLQPAVPEEKPREFDGRRAFDLERRGFDERRGFGDLRGGFDDVRDFDDRRGFDDNRGFDDRRGFDRDRHGSLNDDRRLPNDRLDWSMRETFDHSAKLGDNNDLRWNLNNQKRDVPMNVSWGSAPQVNFSTNDNILGLLAGAVGGANLPISGGIDGPNVLDNYLRQEMEVRRNFDSFGSRNMDNFGNRNMDGRGGDMDNFGGRNMDARGGDMDSFGSRNMDGRGGDMDNFGSRMDSRGKDLDNFGSRNMDSRGNDMKNFGRGGMDVFGDRGKMDRMGDARDRLMDRNKGNNDMRDRGMDSMRDNNEVRGNFNKNMGINRDRGDNSARKDSPNRQMDDNDDLEIIEERVPDQSWKNAKVGGGGPVGKKPNPPNKRGFRGRLGGFRPS